MWYIGLSSMGIEMRTLHDLSLWWDERKGKPRRGFEDYGVYVSADGKYIATGGPINTPRPLHVYETAGNQLVAELGAWEPGIWSVAFSPDDTRVACACSDGTVRLWDIRSRQELIALRGHQGAARAVAFSADGNRLYSVGGDLVVREWDGTPLE